VNTRIDLWLDNADRSNKSVVIYEEENVRVTVIRNVAHFEIRDEDRNGVERWRDIDVDWAIRKMLTITAQRAIHMTTGHVDGSAG
jgi:hypothetical protein